MLERFTEPVYRPPLYPFDLMLRVTQGCTWNRCSFCAMTRQSRMLVASDEEIEFQLRDNLEYYPPDTRVWCVGPNPLALPAPRLLRWFGRVRAYYPRCGAIAMQSRVADVARKSMDELRALRRAGLSQLFLGLESGDDATLRLLNKGQDAATALTQMRRLEEAGIAIIPMVMLGAGGAGTALRNAAGTARLLNRVTVETLSTTGLTVFPGAPLWDMRARGEFVEMSEYEKVVELRALLGELDGTFLYFGRHRLNPVRFTARFPREKAASLARLDRILAERTPEELEVMVDRGAVASV